MLNPFPLQFLSLLAYTLLRLFLGFVLVRLGFQTVRSTTAISNPFRQPALNRHYIIVAIGCFEMLLGTLYVVGLMTQFAALGTKALASLVLIFAHKTPVHPWPERLSWKFILVSSLSLFITGAGIFAFDLPL